jgi:hypothetical protein
VIGESVDLGFADGNLVGFYALASGQVELTQRQRTRISLCEQVNPVATPTPETVGASWTAVG